jgi:electron transfer flavoprotein alpha/beta subunit
LLNHLFERKKKAVIERDFEGDVEILEATLPLLVTAQQGFLYFFKSLQMKHIWRLSWSNIKK